MKLEELNFVKELQAVSHLLFADDSLILFRANGEDATKLQGILYLYEECSGQTINKDKPAIMFSTNTGDVRARNCCDAIFGDQQGVF